METRFAALVARFVDGEAMNVSAQCAELGVTTQTFYKYVRRFRDEGVSGFFPRSRRPLWSPTAVSAEVEDAVVLARKVLDDDGFDIGATSIGWWLIDHRDRWDSSGQVTVPSRATINRVLDHRALLEKYPQRRPRRSYRRFTRSSRNELWQMDGYEHFLADGTKVVAIEIFDDHSRVCLAAHAAASENGDAAWAAFTAAVDRYGLPRQLLTDNGSAFNLSRRGITTRLEAAVAELGVQAIAASVRHPQTCGKVERGHGTGRRWLRRQHTAPDLPAFGEQLQRYRGLYNDRRHQALGGLTPNQAWAIAPVSGPYGSPLAGRLSVTRALINQSGCIQVGGAEISVGRANRDKTATIFRNLNHIAIFIDGVFHRELTIDRTRRYQPNR